MKYLLRTPDGRLALFDEETLHFEVWDIDPAGDLEEIRERCLDDLTPRLFKDEVRNATDDLSVSGEDETPHPNKLARWERAIRCIVIDRDIDHAFDSMQMVGFADWPIPKRVLEEKIRQEVRIEAILNPHRPVVDSTRDEALWADI